MADGVLVASLNGITPVPAGHVATIKSYLERATPPGAPVPLPGALHLARLRGDDEPRYRSLFSALGARWLWWSRLLLTPAALAAQLDERSTEAFAVVENGADVGLLEWDFAKAEEPELAFLGLLDHATGRGIGSALMAATLERMFRDPITRVRLNTCTLDDPAALGFYRRWGFGIVAQAVEIVPDPRLSGLLPPDAAPHVPMIGVSASCS